jgi:hypothetical protein
MARMKQTAKKLTGGKASENQLAAKAARVACGGNSGVERETRLRMTSSVMHVFNNGS